MPQLIRFLAFLKYIKFLRFIQNIVIIIYEGLMFLITRSGSSLLGVEKELLII